MEVFLIAYTVLNNFGTSLASDFKWNRDPFATDADSLTEFTGRSCYQSWTRPRAETAENRPYIGNVIRNQDFSIMEHASATVYVRGVSRAFSHQMIRHRHFSYSQLSQRYVNETGRADWVTPEVIETHPGAWSLYRDAQDALRGTYADIVTELEAEGLTRKQARDAARYILPNGQETQMCITGNHRAWREFFSKRRSGRASDEIHEFANLAFDVMKGVAPNCYQDME